MDLFRPFIAPENQHGLRSYLPVSASPLTIFAASAEQLKGKNNSQPIAALPFPLTIHAGLIFEYTHRFTPAEWNLWFYSAIVYAANCVLNDKRDPERRIHCFFYAQISLNVRLAMAAVGEIGQAILAMGHDRGAITTAEAVGFAEHVHSSEKIEEQKHSEAKSGFTMDAGFQGRNVPADDVDNLVGRFEEILLFDQFTEDIP